MTCQSKISVLTVFWFCKDFACDEHGFICQLEIFQGLVILGADQKDRNL